MNATDQFSDLMCCDSVAVWRDLIFKFGNDLGFEQMLLAILPDQIPPVEMELAFLHTNYSAGWRNQYDAEKMQLIDPAITHCISKSTPLIWSPDCGSTVEAAWRDRGAGRDGWEFIHAANHRRGFAMMRRDTPSVRAG